jgi:ADP-ribosylglycohydrolase
MLWDLLDMTAPLEPNWWLDQYVQRARELETGADYSARGGVFRDYKGPVWRFAHEKVRWAQERNLPVLEACQSWHSGAYLLESIVRAVNDTKDNDTIAAIVGAAARALHGKSAIPQRWIDALSGRTTDSDNGKIFALISRAREVFC